MKNMTIAEAMSDADDLRDRLDDMVKERDEAQAELAAALKVLREVEWSAGVHPSCPSCGVKRWGEVWSHASTCALAACLKEKP